MTPARGTGRGVVFVLAASVVSLAGCSGESSSAGDGGEGGESSGGSSTGGTGTGGTNTGGTGTGGTGGAARPAKVGLYLLLRNPTSSVAGGRQCPASTGIEWDIGMPVLSNGMIVDVDSPTPTDFGSTLEHGEHDAEITCSVTAGGAFEAAGGGIDPMIQPPNGRVSFEFVGTASPPRETTLTDISLYTPVTFQLTNSGGPACEIPSVHEVGPGALWADFDCPALVSATSPDVACHASGTIVVEYCATQ